MTFRFDKLQTAFENCIETLLDIFAEASLWKEVTLFPGFSCAPVANRGKAEHAVISEKWATV